MEESRRQRAKRLGAQSWELIKSDRRLVVFPFAGAVVALIIGAASFAAAYRIVPHGHHYRLVILLGGIIASYPVTFVVTFSGVALATVLARILDGQPVSAADGWRMARARTGIIAAWTLVACTIGAVLRLIEEYVPLGGKVTAWLVDLTWTLVTLFALPVIAYEGRGPRETVRRSAEIFRRRWAEQVGGSAVIIAGSIPLLIVGAGMVGAGVSARGPAGVALAVTGGGLILATQAFASALNQIYRVCLYRSALDPAAVTGPFSAEDLSHPMHQRKRRWWMH